MGIVSDCRSNEEVIAAASRDLDLRRQNATEAFVADVSPDAVIVAAAKVGGIHTNRSAQGEFLYDNLMIAATAIEASRRAMREITRLQNP